MMLRFTPDATAAQREAVEAALRRVDALCEPVDGALRVVGELAPDELVAIAAMPGVAEIAPASAAPDQTTRREAILSWFAGACTVLGVLVVIASLVPAKTGAPADPLRTPGALQPSWPLLPWHAAFARVPWNGVPFLFVLAAIAMFAWPALGGGLAQKRPRLHALLGVATLAAAACLAALEIAR